MDENRHIELLEETAAALRRMRTDEVLFMTGRLEITESLDGVIFTPHQRGTNAVGKFLRVQEPRRLLTQDTVPPGAKIRRIGQGSVVDVQHYPLWTIYPDGVVIPGPNIQLNMSVRFLTWRHLTDEWQMFACPPWDFWQPCYESLQDPVEEAIAVQGVGPRRVNLEDAPVVPQRDDSVPF